MATGTNRLVKPVAAQAIIEIRGFLFFWLLDPVFPVRIAPAYGELGVLKQRKNWARSKTFPEAGFDQSRPVPIHLAI